MKPFYPTVSPNEDVAEHTQSFTTNSGTLYRVLILADTESDMPDPYDLAGWEQDCWDEGDVYRWELWEVDPYDPCLVESMDGVVGQSFGSMVEDAMGCVPA